MKLLDLFESIDNKYRADMFIKYWTNYPDKKRIDKRGLKAALEEYPLEAGTKLYRGLFFRTKAEYDKFLKKVQGGSLTEKSVSSWTQDQQQAETYGLMDDEYDEDYYGSVLLETTAKESSAVDCSKSHHGENEVLLVAGKYDVKVTKTKLK